MLEITLTLVYGLGLIGTWRRAAWLMLQEISFGKPDGADVGFALVTGLIIGSIWPVIVPGYILYRYGLLSSSSRAFLKPPGYIRKKLELELEEREQRIEKLEKELGIK